MLLLSLGLLLVLLGFGLMLNDMERRRRQLAEMVTRVEPLVDRARRLHVRNMHGLTSSLFYTSNLLDQLEREVTLREREKGLPPPASDARFSLRPGRSFRDLEKRITTLELMLQPGIAVTTDDEDPPTDVTPPSPAG